MNYLHFKLLRTYRVKMKYRMMTGSPRNCILDQAELRQILNQAKDEDIITSKQYDSLWIDNPMIATFYLLPKIHKHATTPPGRPIVSGCNNFCDRICKLIDHVLRKIVETLPSYLRDTTDVLRRMEHIHMDSDMLIVTCDVESLYTSIHHVDGLRAVQAFLMMSEVDDNLMWTIRDMSNPICFENQPQPILCCMHNQHIHRA
ncbi:uncharacterized protein LOC130362492 [Hyla sarda]|uniref:uncharacterized protein LOC130362492 n=1 Tax=Hyla sarda TaxID=327740 RepID=UPI0024C3EA54|nr:uncharacterized protein LOC130362492 [Hyla sarda]